MPTNARVNEWAQKLDFAGLESKHGLPAGILTNLVYQESRGNPNAKSHMGAKGLCQFIDSTAKAYGVDVTSPASSAKGAAKFLEDLMDMFNGDVDKAIAAYNCGPGNVRKAMRRAGEGGDWRKYIPNETKDYLKIVGEGIGGSYAQRIANGEDISVEDEAAEKKRRHDRLIEAGYSEDQANAVTGNEILGMLFFALIRRFVESRVAEARAGQADANDITTTRQERVQEFGEGTVKRAEEIDAKGSKKLPVQDVDPNEPVAPLPTRVAQKVSTERTPILVG